MRITKRQFWAAIVMGVALFSAWLTLREPGLGAKVILLSACSLCVVAGSALLWDGAPRDEAP